GGCWPRPRLQRAGGRIDRREPAAGQEGRNCPYRCFPAAPRGTRHAALVGATRHRRLTHNRRMLDAAVAGALAGYAIAVPVGAIAVLIIHTAITRGLRNGVAAAWGVASADGIYASLAVV